MVLRDRYATIGCSSFRISKNVLVLVDPQCGDLVGCHSSVEEWFVLVYAVADGMPVRD